MENLTNFRRWLTHAITSTFRDGEPQKKPELLPPLVVRRRVADKRNPMAARQDEVMNALADLKPSDWTYDELQEIVRARTGTACSRKVIARWKRENLSSSSSQLAA